MKGTSAQADSLRVIIVEPKELGLGAWDGYSEHVPAGVFFPLEGGGRQGGKGNVELCL